jgi:Ca2+/Na+ antiporter
MRHLSTGNTLAIGVLVCGTMWMVLRVSGVFKVSSVQFPAWAGFLKALGILAGPASVALPQSFHWIARLFMFVLFGGCVFVFPWFYNQLPLYFWLTMLLVYLEVFWAIPLLLKTRSPLDGNSPRSERSSSGEERNV